jgi:hypothetical protein
MLMMKSIDCHIEMFDFSSTRDVIAVNFAGMRCERAIVRCTALYSTVPCFTVLYCTALHCTVPCFTVLYCTVLYCTVPFCTVLYRPVPCFTVLYRAVLYFTFVGDSNHYELEQI